MKAFDRVHVDVETFSEQNIKDVGAARYARDPSTRLLVMKYAFNDDEIKTYTPQYGFMHDYSDMPKDFIRRIVENKFKLVAFNLFFEWNIFKHILGISLTFDQCYCSQAMCAYNALPLDLHRAGMAIGLGETERKDKAAGTRLINLLCKPQKDGKEYSKPDREQKLMELDAYCEQDVVTERNIFTTIKPLSTREYQLWQIDQRMNARGIRTDVPAIKASIKLRDKITALETKKLIKLTDGALKTTAPAATKKYLADNENYPLDNFTKETLIEVMKDESASDRVKDIVRIRQNTGRTSLTKYDRLLECVCEDDRIRGLLQYHAAAPGRWGGRLIQPQNLPRPTFDEAEVFVDNLLAGDDEINEILFGNLFDGLQTCIRSMLVPSEGKTLFVSDYSAIEARVLAWLANEQGVLQVFRTHGRIYEHTASLIYRKHIDDVTYDERFVGKTGNLSLGFQGGARAYIKMCAKYGVENVSHAYAEQVKVDWREANPNIVSLWAEADGASKAAISRPNKIFHVYGDGHRFGSSVKKGTRPKFAYCMQGSNLLCKLPSGRCITYIKATLIDDMLPWGKMGTKINYWGLDSKSHQWCKQDLYGGKAAHNATQGTARDVMAHALFTIDASKEFTPLISVHDEIISEGDPNIPLKKYDDMMLDIPAWAEGLPVSCKGEKVMRYGK
jgi:DNA polymerase